MSAQKFEQLIDLIINENEEKARELFHDIVVEKSREIYESMMEDGEMQDEVGGLMDEISADETGMMEDEDELDVEFDDEAEEAGDDLTKDIEDDHDEEVDFDIEGSEEGDIEDRVVDLEDKLDELMAEFEEIMGQDEFEAGEEEIEDGEEEEIEGEEDEGLLENVDLKKVSVTHGDNGSQTKSPVAANSGKIGMEAYPVQDKGAAETGRPAPKAASLKGAGSFANTPGKDGSKGAAAPKPTNKSEKVTSPVAKS